MVQLGDLGCSVQSQARFCPAGLLSAFSCSSTGWNPTRCVRPTQADRGAPPRLLFSDCLLGNPPAEAGWDPGCTGHIQAEATQGVGSGAASMGREAARDGWRRLSRICLS